MPIHDVCKVKQHLRGTCELEGLISIDSFQQQHVKKKIFFLKNGHHARPRRASATAPLRTGADMCRTGVGAGSSAGADKGPDCRQSNHERTDDQAGRRRPANTDADGENPVHAAADTPSKNAATSDTHCNFMRQGGGRPRAATVSRRNGTRQAVAATTGVRSEGNAAGNTPYDVLRPSDLSV